MNANEIRFLRGAEAVRARPRMFLGTTDLFGLRHYFTESIRFLLSHHPRWITLSAEKGGYQLRSDASIDLKEDGQGRLIAFETFVGMGFFGTLTLNALSDYLSVSVASDRSIEIICYQKGERISREKQARETTDTGTTLRFVPDASIFSVTQVPRGMIVSALRQLSYLYPGIRFQFTDEKGSLEFHSQRGLLDLFDAMTSPCELLHEPIHITASKDDLSLELVFAYQFGKEHLLQSFADNLHACERGTHEEGLRDAFPQIKAALGLSTQFDYGCLAVLSLHCPYIAWGGAQRRKVLNTDLREEVREMVVSGATRWANENPAMVEQLHLVPTFQSVDDPSR